MTHPIAFLCLSLVILPEKEIKANKVFLSHIKGCGNTLEKNLRKPDEKRTSTFIHQHSMEQQRRHFNFTVIIARNDARPWDEFVIDNDTSTTMETDIK